MEGHDYFLLVPPAVVGVFVLGFALVARMDPGAPGARLFALAYAGGALSMFIDWALRHDLEVWGGYPANLPYLVSGGVYAAATYARFGLRPSLGVCVGLPVVQLVLYSAFLVADDLPARALVMNVFAGVVLGAPVIACWPRARSALERAVLVLLTFSAAQYVVRTAILVRIEGPELTAANYAESLIVKTTSFATAIAGVLIALLLIAGYGMRVIERTRADARTDPLTGLLNRRGLDEMAPSGTAGAVVVVDIDRFKLINDGHGHAAGDRVIAALARVLHGTARPGDLVARAGGEEFVVVMPRATPDLARLWAEAVRIALRDLPVSALGVPPVTASFGVAPWPDGVPLHIALESADRALYQAKDAGRDRTVVSRHAGRASGETTDGALGERLAIA